MCVLDWYVCITLVFVFPISPQWFEHRRVRIYHLPQFHRNKISSLQVVIGILFFYVYYVAFLKPDIGISFINYGNIGFDNITQLLGTNL